MADISTHPLELPQFEDRDEVSRADLVFYGVDHSGDSFTAHVFLAKPKATLRTARTAENGYAGSFTVFGHGGCFGDEGHCLPSDRYTDEFDLRPEHPLTPLTKTVVATEALAPLLLNPECTEVTVDVVAETTGRRKRGSPALQFASVRLLTYVD
jgi:hypothetical protein